MRVVIAGDSHCGHVVGLTPPEWQIRSDSGRIPRLRKFKQIERETWRWFENTVAALQPIDLLLWTGDSIDGKGARSGATELLIVDRNLQVDMAEQVLRAFGAKRVIMVYGTPYHTGQEEDLEDQLAGRLGAKIGSHEWVQANGLTFDLKHFVGSSVVPYGRVTAVQREEIWNALWAEAELQPRADVVVRGHVHYCVGGWRFVGGRQVWALTAPALQAMGTKFGSRRCSGTVDLGLLHWDITSRSEYTWQPHVANIKAQRARPLIISG